MSTRELWVSANDRFKERAGDWTTAGIIAAVLMHAGVFAFFPELNAADLDRDSDEAFVIELPPEVVIPPAPEEISRPARPVVPDVPVDDLKTIGPTDFDSNPVKGLSPPPPGDAVEDVPRWIPRDVEPRMLNEREIERVLRQRYPTRLREAGIGGTVVLFVYVDAEGRPRHSRVQTSSGYPQLDAAAAEIVSEMRFSPAQNRDQPIGVWVSQAVVFGAR